MKIELFNFIDESIKLLRNYNKLIEEISLDCVKTLKDKICLEDSYLNITHRIKSENSLREKIIKNNLYSLYDTPESMIMNLSDLIGIRIECRFVKEEDEIYKQIKNKFNIEVGDGYYKFDLESSIKLKLSEKQPQIQKNGFEIYKIDGIYEYGKNSFNFELQIKSMVNVFWGEIDHKILYKNYNYMITEGFFKDIMGSIKDSLTMIDRQLMILNDHVSSLDASAALSAKIQLNYLLSKIIHDVYSNKIKEKFGFVFNFKNSTDLIVEYLQMKAVKEKDISYGENFLKIINKINDISNKDLNIEDCIEFYEPIKYFDDFNTEIGIEIEKIINKDFSWNLILKIIHSLDGESYDKNLKDFLAFIRYKYSVMFIEIGEKFNFKKDALDYFERYILNIILDVFKEDHSLDFLVSGAIRIIEEEINRLSNEKPVMSLNILCSNIEEKLKDRED